MSGKTGKQAVEWSNYMSLYDYVAAGLRDLDEAGIPLLFEEDEESADGSAFAAVDPVELDALLSVAHGAGKSSG